MTETGPCLVPLLVTENPPDVHRLADVLTAFNRSHFLIHSAGGHSLQHKETLEYKISFRERLHAFTKNRIIGGFNLNFKNLLFNDIMNGIQDNRYGGI